MLQAQTHEDNFPPFWSFSPGRYFNDESDLAKAAQTYARIGVPVFPLEPGGKNPLVARGFYAATCDQHVIRQWWQRYPDANIGMPTGQASGCWVLDVDPRHGGLESLVRLQQDALASAPGQTMQTTRIQLTGGGGLHFCYGMRKLAGVALSNSASFAGYRGLDLRVGGGYIVVAPSRHKSGHQYRWHNDLPLSPFPTLLVERWRAHYQRASVCSSAADRSCLRTGTFPGEDCERDPEYWLRCALKYGTPGCRHNYALFLACRLIDEVGMAQAEAEPYLRTYAQQVPQDAGDPFSIEEALSCLEWAASRRTPCSVG